MENRIPYNRPGPRVTGMPPRTSGPANKPPGQKITQTWLTSHVTIARSLDPTRASFGARAIHMRTCGFCSTTPDCGKIAMGHRLSVARGKRCTRQPTNLATRSKVCTSPSSCGDGRLASTRRMRSDDCAFATFTSKYPDISRGLSTAWGMWRRRRYWVRNITSGPCEANGTSGTVERCSSLTIPWPSAGVRTCCHTGERIGRC